MKIRIGILSLIAGIILASCSTGNDVVSGRGIQKRKYNDGYYISWANKFNDKKSSENSDVVLTNDELGHDSKNNLSENEITENEKSIELTTTDQEIPTGDLEVISGKDNIENSISVDHVIARPLTVNKNGNKLTIKPGRILSVNPELSSPVPAESGLMLVLLVILCFILAPLAVFIYEGATSRFWIVLVLWLLGWGVGWWLLGGLGGLCTLVAVIFALLIVLGVV